tara:strand:- start:150 stop:599 length:450 start_codon:yes stop_codon:yes gene_type:complete
MHNYDFIYNISYEIIVTAQRGVLPVEALVNAALTDDKWLERSYRLDWNLFSDLFYNDKGWYFDDTSVLHWQNYYTQLNSIAQKHDCPIIEHMYGIYMITNANLNRADLNQYSRSLFPLRIDNEEASEARMTGLKQANMDYNNRLLIVRS